MMLVCLALSGVFHFALPDTNPQRMLRIERDTVEALERNHLVVRNPSTGETWRLDIPPADRGQPLETVLDRCKARGAPSVLSDLGTPVIPTAQEPIGCLGGLFFSGNGKLLGPCSEKDRP